MKLLKAVILSGLLIATFSQAQNTVKVLRLSGTDAFPAWFDSLADKFTEETGIVVDVDELENEDFKKKLPTLLQTDEAPDIFYSWGGGVYYEQAASGATRDVTSLFGEDFLANQSAAGMNAFTVDGQVMGVPFKVSQVGFFYNKALVEQAGVDVSTIATWDDFLAAVQQVKDAGITPIVVGGADKWPLHFYWSYLAMRVAGQEGLTAARAGEASFSDEPFVVAGNEFKRLIDLEPFQEGFSAATYNDASALFGNGNAAFHLMGDWEIGAQSSQSEDGLGLEDDLGFFNFPVVEGGAGRATDTLGGFDGFAFSKDAPDEAVQFMEFFLSPENQLEAGKQDLYIPIVKGSDAGIENEIRAQISRNVAESQWHQLFLDQDLGADVGGVVNDISLQLATGDIDPQGAAELIQEAWELR